MAFENSLIAANDLADAIRIAARIPGPRLDAVEIRPVMEVASLPTDECPRRDAMHLPLKTKALFELAGHGTSTVTLDDVSVSTSSMEDCLLCRRC
jgi:hypothetical protein